MSKTTSRTGAEKDKCAHQRRKNRKGVPGNEAPAQNPAGAQRVLQDAIERHQLGLDGLNAARSQLLPVFARIERMSQQIDRAFAGQMFLPDFAPDDPANRRRVMAFLRAHAQVVALLDFAMTLWMRTCGMKLEDDWVPLMIEKMKLDARKISAERPVSGG